jgi:hypothetical protein
MEGNLNYIIRAWSCLTVKKLRPLVNVGGRRNLATI